MKTAALKAYAKQSKNPKLELQAAEIRLRAKRRIGDLSKLLDKAPGAGGHNRARSSQPREEPTKSAALKAYAKQSKNPELELMAAEIRLRAKRRIGDLSKLLPKNESNRSIYPVLADRRSSEGSWHAHSNRSKAVRR